MSTTPGHPIPTDPSRAAWLRDERVDLIGLALHLWSRRWWIVLATLSMGLVFLSASLLMRKEYESSILLLPTETPKLDQLGAAAALLGKKGGSSSVDLELYQTLLTSRTVTSELLVSDFVNRSDTGKDRTESLALILGIDTSDPGAWMAAEENLAEAISVSSVGPDLGSLIQVTAKAPQPWLARDLATAAVRIGQEVLRRVRIERSETILSRLALASESARKEWDTTAREASDFRAMHRGVALPDQQYRLEKLLLEKQIKEQKYLLARREVEQIELDKEKAAPPAMILEKATTPSRPSRPKRLLLTIVGLALGGAISCAGIAAWSLLVPELNRRA